MKKFAIINFFPVVPTNMGSAEVVLSFFSCIKQPKKIFQISHLKKINKKKIKTFFIIKENPFLKIINIPFLILNVIKYLNGAKKQIVIIEGPSWIGYSFLSIILLKIFFNKCLIVYHSHSIEYEIRKENSNFIISYLTKYLERIVYKISDIATSVSQIEKERLKKLYDVDALLVPNGVSIKRLKVIKGARLVKQKYIIYPGSYNYKPNKIAIDILAEKILPSLNLNFPDLKLVITGGGYKTIKKNIINLGLVSKQNLIRLIKDSEFLCLPIQSGSGTRIKIIEALILGKIIITTKKGIEGINYALNKNPPFVENNLKKFIKICKEILRNKKKLELISRKQSKFFKKNYGMENISKKFINEILKKTI
jgi:glycosyltransferase involved in cell wall biosynthesis